MSAVRSRTGGARHRRRAGVTLVELMVAVFVIGVALLTLAGVSTNVMRMLTAGGRQAIAAMVVQSRLDSLASVAPCRTLVPIGGSTAGNTTTRGIRESWVITSGNNVIYVTDTVRFAGRTRPLIYHSVIVCRNS